MQFAALVHSDHNEFSKPVIAIIGGGGKSTLMERLAREFSDDGLHVAITSTTKFQVSAATKVVLQSETPDYLSVARRLAKKHGFVAVAKESYREKNRLVGVSRKTIVDLRKQSDVVVIEADGSRQRPLKTHKEYEPVIPSECTHVIIICGAEVVGQPLDDKSVHRAELFARKWDMRRGDKLTPEVVTRELLSPYSYLKNIPIHANISILVNKADKNPIGARLLAEKLLRRCHYPIFMGSLKKNQLQRMTLNSTGS